MSKENFSWKGLFINENSEASTTPTQKPNAPKEPVIVTQFPDVDNTSQKINIQNSNNNPFLNEILQVYENGLNSLNLPDFDFFELYKSVIAVGPTNPQSYQMAFTMGKTIKSDLTKEYLIEKAKYYISEIEKVHAKFDETGKNKKQELDINIAKEKNNLSQNITDLQNQIINLQNELEAKRAELLKIQTNSTYSYSEIEMKIEANNYAKKKILDSINLVISGVNQYL